MRLTARSKGMVRGAGTTIAAPQTAQGSSFPAPVGGWDAMNPLANMPPQNAVQLVNFFPQPGYVELRRGHLVHCDTGTGLPVESVMGYQGTGTSSQVLFAASDGDIFDVTTSPAVITTKTGLSTSRIQHTMFSSGGGNVLWCCTGGDVPFYYNGTAWVNTAITGITSGTPSDIIQVIPYRSRLWGVLKDTTIAVYLGVQAITGAAAQFDVGPVFPRGGYLQAIQTWGTDVNNGPNEFIAFISSYGDVAMYLITDPTTAAGIQYMGTSQIGSPIGRRCGCRVGSDSALITIDGVIPLSKIINYDRAAIQNQALTANIRTAMTEAAQRQSEFFGWQLVSYARNTMAILNVPVATNEVQDQFVMNTVTGAWCRFTGQNANCWEVFDNFAYFGGNDGVVRLADVASGDQDQTLEADMQTAFNYYGLRGMLKQWQFIRPLITINTAFPTTPFIGINVDFATNAVLSPIQFNPSAPVAIWNNPATLWDSAQWPGDVQSSDWASINGLGYCASVRMTVSIPWEVNLETPRTLRFNSFDVTFEGGGFI